MDAFELGDDIDMTHYTREMWRDEIGDYLKECYSLSDADIEKHLLQYFTDLSE